MFLCILGWKLNMVITFLRNFYVFKYPNLKHLEEKKIILYAYSYNIEYSDFWDSACQKDVPR